MRGVFQFLVIPAGSHEAGAAGLAEGQTELCARNGVDDGFMQIFYGLDEVALAEDDVGALRRLELDLAYLQEYFRPSIESCSWPL